MKYKQTKLPIRELRDGEKYFTIRYEYNHRLYKCKIAAIDQREARQEFNRLHDDVNCHIHTINFT